MNQKLIIPALLFLSQIAPLKNAIAFGGKGVVDTATANQSYQMPAPISESPEFNTSVGAAYRSRYALKSASQKLVDNQGNGHDALYGVRNFRGVLNGVYYRGGANNVYNKHKKRSNTNPLPNEGLDNLCKEGFSTAIYLYATNFSTAPKQTRCRTYDGNENTLDYIQVSPLDYNTAELAKVHALILDHVRDARRGPIYAHCWNGWHASGYLAATTLRQFCDFTADQAVAYWNTNTDGNNGSSYNGIRNKIRAFVPNRNLSLSPEEKASLCPAPGNLNFPAKY